MAIPDRSYGCCGNTDSHTLAQAMHMGQGGYEDIHGGGLALDSLCLLHEVRSRQGLFECHDHILVSGGSLMDI